MMGRIGVVGLRRANGRSDWMMRMLVTLLLLFVALEVHAQSAVVLSAARTAGADNYTIELEGQNFGASAYVNIIYPGSSTIAAQYIGSPPLTRWTSGGMDHLSFVVTNTAQRSQLNSGGFNLYVVNPTNSTFDGPKLLVRVPPPNQAPVVSITSPASNASFGAPANISINATASDPDGNGIQRVDFYNGSTLLGPDTSAPYSYTWSGVAVGSYTLRAIAYDGMGAASAASEVVVNVISNGVVLSAARTAGADNYTIELDGQNFGSSAYVNVIYPGGSTIAAHYLGSPPLTRWTSGGMDHLSFVVTDAAQRSQLNAGGFNLYVVNPTNNTFDGPRLLVRVPPPSHTASITAPSEKAWFRVPATIPITATALNPNGGIHRVEFYDGTTKLGQDETSPYSFTWSNAPVGNHVIRAIAYDLQGTPSSASTVSISVVSQDFQPVLNRGGSNLIWYHVGAESEGCAVEDYALVNDYHRMSPLSRSQTVRNLVKGQLSQMYQAGQRDVTLSLYLSAGPLFGYGSLDAYGVQMLTHQNFLPNLPSQYLTNVRSVVSDAVAAGISHVSIRFLWDGSSNPPYEWSGAYQTDLAEGWKRAIADVRLAVAGTGASVEYDLGAEMMPIKVPVSTADPNYVTLSNFHRWGSELWSWYVANYGPADSVGFSIPSGVSPVFPLALARADLLARLGTAPDVYGATFPASLDIHFYEEPFELYLEADAYLDSIGKSGIAFKVGETFYNDAYVAEQLTLAAARANRSVDRLVQWPLLGPQRASDDDGNYCDHVTLVPLGFSEYLSRGY
jgi:Bacterial Ig domain